MGICLAFVTVLLITAGIYLFGFCVRSSSLLFVLFLEIVLGLIFIFPLLFVFDKLSFSQIFTSLYLKNWKWIIAASFTGYVGGNFFSLLNLKQAGEKTNSLLSPAITACAAGAAFFIFQDHLSFIAWCGVFITLAAVIYFLAQREGNFKGNFLRDGLLSGLLTIIFITLTIICSIKAVDSNVSLFQAIWLRLLIAFFMVLPYACIRLKKDTFPKKKQFYLAICAGVILQTMLANYLWFWCTLKIGIALFQAILATLPLFVFATDSFLFKRKKPSLSFFISSVLAFAGILLATIF